MTNNELVYLFKEHQNKKAYDMLMELFNNKIYKYLFIRMKLPNVSEFFVELKSDAYLHFLESIEKFNYKKMDNFLYWSSAYVYFKTKPIIKKLLDIDNKKGAIKYYKNEVINEKEYIEPHKREKIDKLKNELYKIVLDLINKDKRKDFKTIVKFRLFDNMKFKDIAKTMNLSEGYLKMVYYRGIKNIKKQIVTNEKFSNYKEVYENITL